MLASDYNALESRIAAMLTGDENMVKVFTDGLDSHSQNTFIYANGDEPWYNQVRQAEKQDKTYTGVVNGKQHFFIGTDVLVFPDGTKITAEAYYGTKL